MSICLEPNTVLTSQVSTNNHASTTTEAPSASPGGNDNNHVEKVSVAKIIMANNNQTIQSSIGAKVVNPPLITVMNTPITVVKTLSSTTPSHFTLVNSAVKSPTITLVNAPPITVVKNITSETIKPADSNTCITTNNGSINNGSLTSLSEKAVHNVFVKKSVIDSGPDIPQSHKILTANSFPTSNVVQNIANSMSKTVNGQKPVTQSKVKILSNVVMSSAMPGPSNLLLNKTNSPRFYPQQKVANNTTQKYISKAPPPNNLMKSNCPTKQYTPDKMPQRVLYSSHKGQYKTIPSVPPSYATKAAGIKTLSPQGKGIPGQVQRTSSGLRTIPPQRPQKTANKTNYIGKHAVQAQKLRPPHIPPKIKSVKHPSPVNSYHSRMPQSSQVTFNQALTAQILETLGQDSSKTSTYETSRYDAFTYMESKLPPEPPVMQRQEYKPQSNLDTLSFVCQAVLLDHNYNATLPAELPTTPTISTSPQINGVPGGSSLYSPGSSKRGRTTSTCSATLTIIPPPPTLPNNGPNNIPVQDDDAASDISCTSDRKMDTEGEETDTAPEAEAVTNDDPTDRYGDYVTRCICGFIHDDGYMIECDQCKVWQHVRCVIKNKKVPDDYLCEVCDPTKQTDRQKARALQQQWMREIQEREARLRKEQMKEMTDTDSSDGEMMPNNNNLTAKGRRKSDTNRQVRQRRDSAKDPVARRPLKRKERKIVKRKVKSHNKSHSDDEKRDGQLSQLPQLRQWIDNYEEAVTNHYSPELRARISNIRINGAHSELTGQVDPSVHKCRVHNLGAGIKCLLATCNLASGVPVVELRGKYMLSTQHRTAHGGSLTTRQQRPGPFLFFYRLHRDNTEVCVDTRTYGNSARFVRRSCQPNAELRHCIEKGVLHLYIVTVAAVEKNLELTIKHESHDLAVVGSTEIPCACGNPERCLVNRVKKNGENLTLDLGHRKRRSRRTMSVCMDSLSPVKPKEEPTVPLEIKQEKEPEVEQCIAKETKEVKIKTENEEEEEEEVKPVKEEVDQVQIKQEVEEVAVKEEVKVEENVKEEPQMEEVKVVEEKEDPPPPPVPPIQTVSTRRASAAQKALLQEAEEKEKNEKEPPQEDDKKDKKLSREERKLQAIMKAIERMERLEQRKQEHQAKQAHRRESEPSPNTRDDDKGPSRPKRRKRKGRARTVSTNSQSGRRNRLDSADSLQATSSDETLLSPSDNITEQSSSKAAGLLLSLSNSDNSNAHKDMDAKSPERTRDLDSNSNSAHSSPETPLSSACLLVAAAVEPLEPGFKFPKTKKGLMNEWLNKGPEVVQSASQISPSSLTPHIPTTSADSFDNNSGFYTPGKNLAALAQAASYCDSPTQPQGSAKKRWLRQAISEDQCDSPCSRPESPPMSDTVAPPKKRRLPRESISTDGTPPTTPTRTSPPPGSSFRLDVDRKDDIKADVEDEASKGEFRSPVSANLSFGEPANAIHSPFSSIKDGIRKGLSDPRLGRLTNSEQLVGTVEKTLSFLGFEDKKPEIITPTKRKLSITEYLQRKKISTCDKSDEAICAEESSNSAAPLSPKLVRNRSNSSSSNTSLASSDDEMPSIEIPGKAVSAFNSEPTELERQRENVSLRVKKALGIPIDENARPPTLGVSSLLKADLQPLSLKTSFPLQSPTFPIPGSASDSTPRTTSPDMPTQSAYLQSTAPQSPVKKPELKEGAPSGSDPVMFYTPDEEEATGANAEEGKFMEKLETTSYVPPFNNPLYPNSSYTTYGSVIDDDVPYEGRNPSPPPNIGGVE